LDILRIIENAEEYIERQGSDRSSLAKRLGFPSRYIADIKAGKSKKPGSDFILALINKLHFNPEWLETGEGDMFLQQKFKYSFTPRIRQLRDKLNLDQAEFAKKLGISRAALIDYEKGGAIPSTFNEKLQTVFGVSYDWFYYGRGEPFGLPEENHDTIEQNKLKDYQKSELPEGSFEGYKVPLLRQKVSCGPGSEWQNEDNIVEYIDVFGQVPRLNIDRLFAFRAEGSSMLGAGIRNGDYVLFDSVKDQQLHDGIYVFALDGDVYCKRLEVDMNKTKIYSVRFADLDKAELVATLDNKDASTAERLMIFGRVLYWIHPNLE